jgi:SAM-dependent methyltransferase
MLSLSQFVGKKDLPEPWSEGEKIPWNEPGFSARMLREHLSQHHDAASRRFALIDQHVAWIDSLLPQRAARILDLGCGPGLYTSRLARLGHTCVGIDFSPASVAYAREQASREGLACDYIEADLRQAAFGGPYDAALFLFGELNVFRPQELESILQRSAAALRSGGLLVLEPSHFASVYAEAHKPARWSRHPEGGLFSERPHLMLYESFWHEGQRCAIERYLLIDAETSEPSFYAATSQAYHEAELVELLNQNGFEAIHSFQQLGGGEAAGDFFALVAKKV